jgi:hypothetical protein
MNGAERREGMFASSMRFAFHTHVSNKIGQEGREHTRPKTINFISINLTIRRIIHNSVLGDSAADTLSKIMHMVCQVSLATYGGHDLGCGVQIPGEHHVCRDKELVDRATHQTPQSTTFLTIFKMNGRRGREEEKHTHHH